MNWEGQCPQCVWPGRLKIYKIEQYVEHRDYYEEVVVLEVTLYCPDCQRQLARTFELMEDK